MTITRERFAGLKERRRNLTGRTGCGLCGVDDLTQVARPLPRVGPGVRIGVDAITKRLNAAGFAAHEQGDRRGSCRSMGNPDRKDHLGAGKMSGATTPSTS